MIFDVLLKHSKGATVDKIRNELKKVLTNKQISDALGRYHRKQRTMADGGAYPDPRYDGYRLQLLPTKLGNVNKHALVPVGSKDTVGNTAPDDPESQVPMDLAIDGDRESQPTADPASQSNPQAPATFVVDMPAAQRFPEGEEMEELLSPESSR